MKVQVIFFAHLRDLAGTSRMEIELAERATVADLLAQLYERFPALRAHDQSILTSAGVEFVGRNDKLKPSDEIAVMPPVQGG